MSDIRRFFGQGGGDNPGKERAEAVDRTLFKRRAQQSKYDHDKRKRTVQAQWMEEYPWLSVSTPNDQEQLSAMFCKICRTYPHLADKDSTLFVGISNKFRKESLKFHDLSKKHTLCMEHHLAKTKPEEMPMAKSQKKTDEKNFPLFDKLFNTAYFIALECEAFTKFETFIQLQEKNGVIFSENYKNNHGCTTFINSIATVIKNETKSDLMQPDVRFCSILFDGSTDKGILEQELIYVRYVGQDGKVKTKYAEIVALEHGHANGVKDGVLSGLESVGLSVKSLSDKLVGINSDGASVNLGSKGGAVKLIIDELKNVKQGSSESSFSYVAVVHCIAHNLELSICDLRKECTYLKQFDETLKGIFNLYYYSPKRRRELHEVAVNLDKQLKHYGGIQQIHWVSSQNRALKALLDNFQVTVIHLEEITHRQDDAAARAKAYLSIIKTEKFLVFLHFMIDFTDTVSVISQLFQLKDTLISEVARRIRSLIDKLILMKTTRGKLLQKFYTEYQDGKFRDITLVKPPAKRGREEGEFNEQFLDDLLDSAATYVDSRFSKYFNEGLLSLFSVFDYNIWPDKTTAPEEFRNYGTPNISKLLEIYSPVLSQAEKDNALDEWHDLKVYMESMRSNGLAVTTAYERILGLSYSNSVTHLKNILPLVTIMLTISPSTAECERGFSQTNRIKTDLRTRLSQDNFSNVMRINMDGPKLHDFNSRPAIEHILSSGKGVKHLKGHVCSGPRTLNLKKQNELTSGPIVIQ